MSANRNVKPISLNLPASKISAPVPSTSSLDGFAKVSFPQPVGGLSAAAIAEHVAKLDDNVSVKEPCRMPDGREGRRTNKEDAARIIAAYYAQFAPSKRTSKPASKPSKPASKPSKPGVNGKHN